MFFVDIILLTELVHLECIPPPSIFTLQPDIDPSVTAPVKCKIIQLYIMLNNDIYFTYEVIPSINSYKNI